MTSPLSLPSAEKGRTLAYRLEQRVRDTQLVTAGARPTLIELCPDDIAHLKAAFGQGPVFPPTELFGVKLKINTRAPRGGSIQ